MAILKSCCFYVSLRTATLVFGILTLVYNISSLAGGSLHISDKPGLEHSALVIAAAMIVFNGLCVIASVLLLVGLCVENKNFLLPWLIIVPLTSVLTMVFNEINQVREKDNGMVMFTIDDLIFSTMFYGAAVVLSQYHEYAAGRGTYVTSNSCF